jgi:Dolichyl-phosphate-mannose-protein mannosyltransferase
MPRSRPGWWPIWLLLAVARSVRSSPPAAASSPAWGAWPTATSPVAASPPAGAWPTAPSAAGTPAPEPVEERSGRLMRMTPWLLLIAVLALAAAVRLWHLDALGANSDEAVYAGQAASIARRPELEPLFPIFRAHPLLFQTLLSLSYHAGGELAAARAISAALGVATVYVTFLLGRLLYGTTAALAAALFLAVMPYHVVVGRQVLLDGPMTLFATLSLYLLARFASTRRSTSLYAAAGAMGLTVLSKETSLLLLGAVYAFFALVPEVRLRLAQAAVACGILAVTVVQFPLVLRLAGSTRTGGNYLAWQLFRRPNHDWGFYPSVVPQAVGPLVLLAALGGLWLLRRRRSWRETLLLAWIVVPVAFFQLWPVKGFQYLLPAAPAVAVLAGRTVAQWAGAVPFARLRRVPRWACAAAPAALVALSLLPTTWHRISSAPTASLLAGAGGLPGGREAGEWLGRETPPGAQLMTIGPSMANIFAFYGHRQAYGLSVSPNPLSRNPSYEPLINPDLAVREGRVQYAVWDAFSAARSPFFAQRLLRYVERYRGRVVHQETLPMRTAGRRTARRPSIVVYVLRP